MEYKKNKIQCHHAMVIVCEALTQNYTSSNSNVIMNSLIPKTSKNWNSPLQSFPHPHINPLRPASKGIFESDLTHFIGLVPCDVTPTCICICSMVL